jgi:hypothetical protein
MNSIKPILLTVAIMAVVVGIHSYEGPAFWLNSPTCVSICQG